MHIKALLLVTLFLSVTSLFLEQLGRLVIVDYVVLFLVLLEVLSQYRGATYKRVYLKRNTFSLSLVVLFVLLFICNKIAILVTGGSPLGSLPHVVLILRNVSVLLGVFDKLKRLSSLLEEIAARPARTIFFGFLLVILAGSLLLWMPLASAGDGNLNFLDAFFTATSAVCVTGLVVVDTATGLSIYGKLIVLALIQIGGLGIMILSYFTIFILRRSVSIEDKMLISYMLSERDMTKLAKSLKNIITITFTIEGLGAVFLYFGFLPILEGGAMATLFSAVFHSVSAFCNAGFSTFSDSLTSIRTNAYLVVVFSLLIVAGGISFAVITNLRLCLVNFYHRRIRKLPEKLVKVSMNTKIVLTATGALLLTATLIIYGTEHDGAMAGFRLGDQYLSSFFQAVTLRTAGFNTISFSSLNPATYVAMAAFMFIGGASGSTAGGIKVNTVAVMIAYLVASVKNREAVILYRNSISFNTVIRAFLILLFGVTVVVAGTFLLALAESAPFEHLIFETVSAFGTVGLSAGVTQTLSAPGKTVIILLMFLGRVGPLTVLAAASLGGKKTQIQYPRGEIAIG